MPQSQKITQPPAVPTDDFRFRIDPTGKVQFTLDDSQHSLSVDAVYELQLCLATFLAHLETEDYPPESSPDSHSLFESRATWEFLRTYPRVPGRLDS